VSNILRLLKILRVIARYRLDEFAENLPGTIWFRLLLLPFRVGSSASKKANRNYRLKKALEELGPIYIKLGQLLSTRRDFLDNELADELQSLQDNVPPFDSPAIENIIEDSLGTSPSKIFKELESKPFASASVAQVHKATLLSGDDVVVKVIRPGIEKTVKQDIGLLKLIAKVVESTSALGKRLRPIEVINDYEKVILGELDLLAEAANTAQLQKNFDNNPVLYVPKVYWDFTRKNMLVMERIDGIPVTNVDELEAEKVDLKKLAETGVEIFFTQVFEHNFFHADMHPGNIFVSRDKPNDPQYIAIDCAIIGSLSDDDQEYLAKNLLAIFKEDYRRVAELHVECGWVPEDTPVHEFESAMRTVCEPIFQKLLKDISFGQLLVQLFRTAGKFNMEVQPSLVLLQKTLLNVEGLGRQLYPELDLWRTALPYLENWNSKRLSPLNLLKKFQENLPEIIEQLPNLPLMLIQALEQSINPSASQFSNPDQASNQSETRENISQQANSMGVMLLILALASLVPALGFLIFGAPILALLLLATVSSF